MLGIYRPPNGDINSFLDSIENILTEFRDKKLIISGDLTWIS